MTNQMLKDVIYTNRSKGETTYQDYYKFIEDEKWYEKLLNEIAPGFNGRVKIDVVSSDKIS